MREAPHPAIGMSCDRLPDSGIHASCDSSFAVLLIVPCRESTLHLAGGLGSHSPRRPGKSFVRRRRATLLNSLHHSVRQIFARRRERRGNRRSSDASRCVGRRRGEIDANHSYTDAARRRRRWRRDDSAPCLPLSDTQQKWRGSFGLPRENVDSVVQWGWQSNARSANKSELGQRRVRKELRL